MGSNKLRVLVVGAACAFAATLFFTGCALTGSSSGQTGQINVEPYIEPVTEEGLTLALQNLVKSDAARKRDAAYIEDFATVLDSIDTGEAPDPAVLSRTLQLRVKAEDVAAIQPVVDSIIRLYDDLIYPQLKARAGAAYDYVVYLEDFTKGMRAASDAILNAPAPVGELLPSPQTSYEAPVKCDNSGFPNPNADPTNPVRNRQIAQILH